MVALSLGSIIGGVVSLAGAMLCIYWYIYFNRNYQGELLTEGPYSIVRHPFYTGFIVFVFGLVFVFPGYETRMLLVITLAVMYVYVPREEEQMLKDYKKEYRAYKKKVPWRLIPYLY